MITAHILGAGGATPTADRGPAAYWIELDGHGVLVDPGPGALVRLVRQEGGPASVDEVDTVLLSHLHLDHTADLAPLLFAQHSVLARREGSLTIIGPVGTAAFMTRLDDLYGTWLEPRCRQRACREVRPGDRISLAGGTAIALPAHHPVARFASDGLGWLFADLGGHRLAYTGDTGPCPEQSAAVGHCDVLLAECSTPDDLAVPVHLSPRGVANLVGNMDVGRVVLTHLYPPIAAQDPAGAVFRATGVPTTAARDGDIVRIPDATEPSS